MLVHVCVPGGRFPSNNILNVLLPSCKTPHCAGLLKYEQQPKMYNSRKMACQKNGGEHYVMSGTCDKARDGKI